VAELKDLRANQVIHALGVHHCNVNAFPTVCGQQGSYRLAWDSFANNTLRGQLPAVSEVFNMIAVKTGDLGKPIETRARGNPVQLKLAVIGGDSALDQPDVVEAAIRFRESGESLRKWFAEYGWDRMPLQEIVN
jgi:hypothetical protein